MFFCDFTVLCAIDRVDTPNSLHINLQSINEFRVQETDCYTSTPYRTIRVQVCLMHLIFAKISKQRNYTVQVHKPKVMLRTASKIKSKSTEIITITGKWKPSIITFLKYSIRDYYYLDKLYCNC